MQHLLCPGYFKNPYWNISHRLKANIFKAITQLLKCYSGAAFWEILWGTEIFSFPCDGAARKQKNDCHVSLQFITYCWKFQHGDPLWSVTCQETLLTNKDCPKQIASFRYTKWSKVCSPPSYVWGPLSSPSCCQDRPLRLSSRLAKFDIFLIGAFFMFPLQVNCSCGPGLLGCPGLCCYCRSIWCGIRMVLLL